MEEGRACLASHKAGCAYGTGSALLMCAAHPMRLIQISGLSALTRLETLDLSDNFISCVSGLDSLPLLSTLILSGNKVRARSAATRHTCTFGRWRRRRLVGRPSHRRTCTVRLCACRLWLLCALASPSGCPAVAVIGDLSSGHAPSCLPFIHAADCQAGIDNGSGREPRAVPV